MRRHTGANDLEYTAENEVDVLAVVAFHRVLACTRDRARDVDRVDVTLFKKRKFQRSDIIESRLL